MLRKPDSSRQPAWLVFCSLAMCYLALAPGTIKDRGYLDDDLKAGMRLLDGFNAWVKGRPQSSILWTRHGLVPLLFDLPFIKLGKLFVSPDFVMSLQALLLTAGLMTLVYIWLRKVCSPGMSLLLTFIGGFGTMLWPYAYIGLETKQSFCICVAGYMGLASGKIRTWPRFLMFSSMSALAISMKSTGIVLAPAIAYLVYLQFRSEWRARWKQALATLTIIASVWTLNAAAWSAYWSPSGGVWIALRIWLINSPYSFFTNMIGILGSPQKGLFVFAPVLLVCVYAIPRVLRSHRERAVFALLVAASIAAFLSTLRVTADEVWGPRFMHVAIAPLLIVIGSACPQFQWRRHIPLLILGAVGLSISFLGAFFYYDSRLRAATAAGQNTMEWLDGDTVWNEVAFNARLFSVWLKGGNETVLWTPPHVWVWTPPPDAQPWKTINLREYADPQAFLLRHWKGPLEGSNRTILRLCAISLFLGPLFVLRLCTEVKRRLT